MSDLDHTRVLGDAERGVVAIGLARHPLKDLYHALVTGSWWRILAVYGSVYFVTQALFGAAHYLLAAPELEALPRGSVWGVFLGAVPGIPAPPDAAATARAVAASAVGGLEGFVRWLELAMGAAIIVAKFSLLKPRVLFSKVAVVAPHDGGRALMFRMANERATHVVDAKVQAMLVVDELGADGEPVRRVHDLPLSRATSPLFSHAWTAIHPIDRSSPLAGHGAASLARAAAEVIVTLTGFDEGLTRPMHTRQVYRAKAIRFSARFRDIVRVLPNGLRAIDYRRFHDTVPVEEPAREERAAARRVR